MNSRFVVSAIAAIFCAGALPVFAQGSGPDRNVPEIPNQPAPQARPAERGPQVQTPARPREQQGQREDHRRDAPRQEHPRDAQRHDNEHRQADRRNWEQRRFERRDYGYVVPQPLPYYYSAPPVYYGPPAVYYGGLPRPYYPNPYAAAPLMFQPGDYLPPELRAQQYLVEDWQWRGLSAPPYGYHWLALGADNFALVADATGQIFSLVATR